MKTKTLLIITIIILLVTGGAVYGGERISEDTERMDERLLQKDRQQFKEPLKQPNMAKHSVNTGMDTDNNNSYTSAITPAEHKLLIKITYLEARGESLEGKTAVVRTILNRVKSKDFPGSIEEVIYQPGQFQPAKYLEEVEVEEEYLEEIEKAIIAALSSEGEELYFVNPVHANQSSYNWMVNNLTFIRRIGNHEFYR